MRLTYSFRHFIENVFCFNSQKFQIKIKIIMNENSKFRINSRIIFPKKINKKIKIIKNKKIEKIKKRKSALNSDWPLPVGFF